MSEFSKLPDFDSLPYSSECGLDGCAWRLFDQHGERDQLGTLNLLTPEKVRDAAKDEILCGQTVSLNWGLENPQYSGFGRKTLQHRILDLTSMGFAGSDDDISFCPQHGSHWDTPLHFAHQRTKIYYNGLRHEDIQSALHQGTRLWNARGGICGRGVLLDWAAWAVEKGHPCHPIGRHEIPVSELEEVAKWQKTTLKPGDILFVRTGFIAWHNRATDDERKRGTLEQTEFLGIEASQESARWYWNHHFSAVVTDNISYEAWPPKDIILHEYFLPMWGMSVGKLWDLEKLSEVCGNLQRWSFFLTSAPLNITSGIGSPSNAIALF